jgi:hypothetical protein
LAGIAFPPLGDVDIRAIETKAHFHRRCARTCASDAASGGTSSRANDEPSAQAANEPSMDLRDRWRAHESTIALVM